MKIQEIINLIQSNNISEAKNKIYYLLDSNKKDLNLLYLLGAIYIKEKNYPEAKKNIKEVLKIKSDHFGALNNLGVIYLQTNECLVAIKYFEKAISLKPDYAQAFCNLGVAYRKLESYDKAINYYKKAISLKPDYAEAYTNIGLIFVILKKYNQANIYFHKAIKVNPNHAEPYASIAGLLDENNKYKEAIEYYEKAIILDPLLEDVIGSLIFTKLKICDWNKLDILTKDLETKIQNRKKIISPFQFLLINDSQEIQKNLTVMHIESIGLQTKVINKNKTKYRNKKIKIGYFSSDFRNHATSYLCSDLFKFHDKNKFEIYGFDLKKVIDETHKKILPYFNEIFYINDKKTEEVVKFCHKLKLDIAIDLHTHTKGGKLQIFYNKISPIQINYLGYPGTSGTNFIDYIIADSFVIPQENKKFFSEKIIYLPNCYQNNEMKKEILPILANKKKYLLPENSFIYCCFSNIQKFTPEIFSSWMRILKGVPDSILWLLTDNKLVIENIYKQATLNNVKNERIIFTNNLPQNEHLQRYKLADLCLDTYPYGAHTTASDCIRNETPIITICGNSFASRVCASILKTVNMPELITKNYDEYEKLAIQIGLNKKFHSELKIKLNKNIINNVLFDSQLFTKNIEKAYYKVYENYHMNVAPADIYVE